MKKINHQEGDHVVIRSPTSSSRSVAISGSVAVTTITATDAYANFVNSLDSEASRRSYLNSFSHFMRFCGLDSYSDMLALATDDLHPLKRLDPVLCDLCSSKMKVLPDARYSNLRLQTTIKQLIW
jgi:hypothetical protein